MKNISIGISNLDKIPEGIENITNCTFLQINVNNIYRSDLSRLGELNKVKEVSISRSELNHKKSPKRMKLKEAYLKKHLPDAEINIYTTHI